MKYKFFLNVQDGKRAEAFYIEHFNATIKKPFRANNNHAYLYLFDKLPLLIYQGHKEMINVLGWHMIRFEAAEVDTWKGIINSIQETAMSDSDIVILTNGINSNEKYGTAWFEFRDPFGVTWNLEIDIDVIK